MCPYLCYQGVKNSEIAWAKQQRKHEIEKEKTFNANIDSVCKHLRCGGNWNKT